MNPGRILLAVSGIVLLAGALIHAAAYKKMTAAVGASNLPAFYAQCLKGLWLIDAATLFLIAVMFASIAARPPLASRPIIILIALIPAATAAFLYGFLGNFPAAHMLMGAAIIAIAGAALL
jgi:hypothetical protein